MRAIGQPILLSLAALVQGCLTAPAAMKQANRADKLMTQLELEAQAFRNVMEDAQVARVASIVDQKKRLATFGGLAVPEDRARVSAVDSRSKAAAARRVGHLCRETHGPRRTLNA